MKIAKLIALVGLFVMTRDLIYGLKVGEIISEGARLVDTSWGIVSLVDMYVVFDLISSWIVVREKDLLPPLIWIVLMMAIGFWAEALHTSWRCSPAEATVGDSGTTFALPDMDLACR